MSNNVAGVAKEMDVERLFLVQIDGFQDTHFAESSEISVELKTYKYEPGGQMLATKGYTGKAEVADITLKRGVCRDFDAYTWLMMSANLAAAAVDGQAGLPGRTATRTGDWVQLDTDKSVKRKYRLVGMRIKKLVAGKWDGKSDSVVIEEITIEYDFPQLIA